MIITGTWTPIKKFIHNIHDVYCVVKIKVFFSYIDISLIQTCYPVSSCLCNNFCSNLRVPAGVSIITDNLVAKISIPDRVRNSPWLISEIQIITGGDLDKHLNAHCQLVQNYNLLMRSQTTSSWELSCSPNYRRHVTSWERSLLPQNWQHIAMN